jgi:hypothetical protein
LGADVRVIEEEIRLARLEAFVRLADHRASEAGAPPGMLSEYKEAAE